VNSRLRTKRIVRVFYFLKDTYVLYCSVRVARALCWVLPLLTKHTSSV